MSQQEYEIHIYGLNSFDVTLKDEYVDEFPVGLFEELREDSTLDKLGLQYIDSGYYDDGDYIGILPYTLYPWEKKPDVPHFRNEEEVKDAIVKAIAEYVEETPEGIRAKIDYHDANGCC